MDALAAIYDTVDGSSSWASALEWLCEAFGAHGAMLALEEPGEQLIAHHQHGFDATWLDDYASNWATKSPYINRFYATPGNAGRFVTSESILPYEHWIRSEMFHESGRKAGVHHSVAAFFDASDGLKVRLSCVRDRIGRPFSSADVARLDQLIPHIAQALRLRDAFPEPLRERLNELQRRQTPRPGCRQISEHHRVQRPRRGAAGGGIRPRRPQRAPLAHRRKPGRASAAARSRGH